MSEFSEIQSLLKEEDPILFVGAGFSYGATRKNGYAINLGQDLCNKIIDVFIKPDISNIEYWKKMDLMKLSEIASLKTKDKLYTYENFLTDEFKDFEPTEFHKMISSFKWKKIYTTNIDDIIEKSFLFYNKKISVQNSKEYILCREAVPNIIKLHGCINNPEEGYLFSRSKYIEKLNNDTDYRYTTLLKDFQESSFIFVGTEFFEIDIEKYIAKYQDRKDRLFGNNKCIFINPKPSPYLREIISNSNWMLIEKSTKEFLEYLDENSDSFARNFDHKAMLARYGFIDEPAIKETMNFGKLKRSRLYFGYSPDWEDVYNDFLFTNELTKDIVTLLSKNQKVITMFGSFYSGKTCFAMNLLRELSKIEDYYVVWHNGKDLSFEKLKELSKMHDKKTTVVLIDDASNYYYKFEGLTDIKSDIRVIGVSRRNAHERKRYILPHIDAYEVEIKNNLSEYNVGYIYNKLQDNGFLGFLTGKLKDDAVKQISFYNTIVDLLFALTNGEQFILKCKEEFKKLENEDVDLYKLIVLLYTLDKLEIGSIDLNLITRWFVNIKKDTIKNCDYFSIIDNCKIKLNNVILYKKIDFHTPMKKEIYGIIKGILKEISTLFTEKDKNYYKILFEDLLRTKALSKILAFQYNEIELAFLMN